MLQAKLAINQPGDAYEQEADRVAAAVMKLTDVVAEQSPSVASVNTSSMPMQRKCSCGGTCASCQDEVGGIGSGRWGNHRKKTQVEDCLVIDAARWQRQEILREGSTCSRGPAFGVGFRVDTADLAESKVHLMYIIKGKRYEYPVLLQTTHLKFGGLRWWFTCPRCQRRVQKLFLPPGAEWFSCRKCYNLSYATRSYDRIDRSNRRAQGIRHKLGGTASLLDVFPSKPKGMWWTTYLRLGDQYRKHGTTALNLFLERMKIPPLFPE